MNDFSVALVQMTCSIHVEENMQKAESRIEEAAVQGADVVCLQELYRSLYLCQTEDFHVFDLAETVPGPSTQRIGALAKAKQVSVVVPIFERRAPGVYHNSIVVINKSGDVAGLYRKMHIPDDPCFYEKYYFTPGDLGFKAIDVEAGRVGPLICWDQWYPEGARLTALQGASVLFYPTAIGWHPKEKAEVGDEQRSAWQTIQRGHAIANGVYVAAVNRTGHEVPEAGGDGIEFWGTSFLCDPFGVVIAEASIDREETLYGEIRMSRIEEIRRYWPFLRDRRIDAYQGIDKRLLDA